MRLVYDTRTYKGYVDFSEEIQRGVDWLDGHDPDWFDKVNLDRLHLESGSACVLGQLAMTSFAQTIADQLETPGAIDGYNDVLRATDKGHSWAEDHGFNVDMTAVRRIKHLGMGGCECGCDLGDGEVNEIWEGLTYQWANAIEVLRLVRRMAVEMHEEVWQEHETLATAG